MRSWEHPRQVKVEIRNRKLEQLRLTKEALTNLYWNKGLSIPKLSNMFPGIDIYEQMKKWNIPRRTTFEGFHLTKMQQLEQKGITKELLWDLYVNQKLSSRAIDEKLGCMAAYYLRYFGIPMRKNTDHNWYTKWTEERKYNHRVSIHKYWSNSKSRQLASERILKRIANGWQPDISGLGTMKFPNNCETKLMKIIEIACPGEYRYAGNNKVRFETEYGTIKPDFLHKYKNKIIEFFGDYWHTERAQCNGLQLEPGRIDAYHSIGYDCLIIWEHDLKEKSEEELIKIIQNFNSRELEPYEERECILLEI